MGTPSDSRRLRYVQSVEESKALNSRPGPTIIISASGMCEGGRILHHLSNNIGKPSTTVLFVGYQAEHTLGRKILAGRSPVPILGSQVDVNARVERADSYSAHADRNELIAWAEGAREKGKRAAVLPGARRAGLGGVPGAGDSRARGRRK